jgi:NADPH:quinone reductase-like Zn-dependent oxidoreductase
MAKAVQFDSYGGIDVLEVRDVPRPVPGAGEVLIEVRAAGINISEAAIRAGAVRDLFPATFPSGQGSDLAAGRIDALLDFFGGGYVAMAVEDLRVPHDRVDTTIDFAAVERFGVLSAGGADAATAAVLAELADLVARGELEVPITGVFALDDVRDAYRELEKRHTRGKLVLRP